MLNLFTWGAPSSLLSSVHVLRVDSYELDGVIQHEGPKKDADHYFVNVKSGDTWYEANDSNVHMLPFSTVAGCQVYLAFYHKVAGTRTQKQFMHARLHNRTIHLHILRWDTLRTRTVLPAHRQHCRITKRPL